MILFLWVVPVDLRPRVFRYLRSADRAGMVQRGVKRQPFATSSGNAT